jgi:large subunit ribosomal protein L4
MIDLTVYNIEGKEVDKIQVDKDALGGWVRYPLLKQAIVMYQANKRVGTAQNRSRGMVEGSTRKLYKQKGTGNARVGNIRTAKRVGGGVTFEKYARDFRQSMPAKQKRIARDSAVLAKILSDNIVLLDELKMSAPKTKAFAGILGNLKINRSCLIAINEYDANIYKSARNIQKIAIMPVADLNAGDVCSHSKLLMTKEAFERLINKVEN